MKSKISLTKSKFNTKYNNNSLASYKNKSNKHSLSLYNNTNSINSFPSSLIIDNSSKEKTNKKKLFTSIYSGYTKTNYGTIPYKTENFLVNKKVKNPRFNDVKSIFYSDKITNPGVGKYNLTKNFELTGWDTKFGGFDDRFKKYVDQVPGVGDYNPEENKNFGKNRNNIRYKSLYKQTNLTQQILGFNGFKDQEGPTCTTYTPLYQDEVMKIKKLYTFDSFIGRDEFTGVIMPFSKRDDNPGPGFYTYNSDLFGANNKQLKFKYDDKNTSYDDAKSKQISDKIVNKFYKNKINPKFKLKSRSPKYNNIKIVTSEELQLKNKTKRENSKKIPELEIILNNIYKEYKCNKNWKFYINQQKELEHIKSILGNDRGKPDLFYLSSPRWKENKFKLKTPGPAYYFNHSLNSFKK